jgi:hypothetical protein
MSSGLSRDERTATGAPWSRSAAHILRTALQAIDPPTRALGMAERTTVREAER